MKNIKFFLIASLFAFSSQTQAKISILNKTLKVNSFDQKKNKFTIKGNVQGFEDGTKVYINEQGEQGFIKIDSTVIKNNTFIINGIVNELELAFIEIGNTQEYIVPFVIEKGEIKVTYDKANPDNAKVIGTKNNDYLAVYNTESNKIQREIRDFQELNNEKMMNAQQSQDKQTIDDLMAEYQKINSKLVNQNIDLIKKNKDAYISLIIIEQLMNGETITFEEYKSYFEAFDSKLKNTKKGKEINQRIESLEKVAIGQIAPDFSAPNPEGKMISLKESLGKVTIIDFWAAWCGPCRQENPNFVALYNKYKNKGLQIIGVSLDRDAEAWKNAIAKDQLTWIQISNIKHWQDPIAQLYQVSSIPKTFILDSSGKIIAKDLRGAELDTKIAELLK
ncbi:AhpC/TSA family protein [Paenimyroides tangerinum]|uniref:AhpC/TSA family protein n=1 Tax=Paenimyroides tangerinum TaxID=2488728 RepID=A0A3P3W552_9FLAO|nr:TlpA disulfide reductase family protein [Paenimyroides tangerinum]RRJ90110.1 AhpC/TSA family protein [Paenimyroides tangerinum]